MRILNSLIVPKILKEGTLWDFFNIRSAAKYAFVLWGHFKNFEKKSHKAEKSHSAEKSENLLLLNTCKKNKRIPTGSNTKPLG